MAQSSRRGLLSSGSLTGKLVAVEALYDEDGQPVQPAHVLSERQLFVYDTRGNVYVQQLGAGKSQLEERGHEVQELVMEAGDDIQVDEIHACASDIPCMGCRSAVEALLKQLATSAGTPAADLGALSVSANRSVYLWGGCEANTSAALYNLVHRNGAKEDSELWVARGNKSQQRTKRCPLHSLKPRAVGTCEAPFTRLV